jgi:hypothetical protein
MNSAMQAYKDALTGCFLIEDPDIKQQVTIPYHLLMIRTLPKSYFTLDKYRCFEKVSRVAVTESRLFIRVCMRMTETELMEFCGQVDTILDEEDVDIRKARFEERLLSDKRFSFNAA